ncbi:hypothetical protein KAW80_04005 [Candidatus Babeliales bacterium]|nr:hypothetical protein [Candidatus Babeliales bacterium]
MCFSATASFSVAGILTGIGIASVYKNKLKSHRMFASIPFFFAVQQFFEGLLWLKISAQNNLLNDVFSYIFLIFAFILWPIWIPISLSNTEKMFLKRRILRVFGVFGAFFSLCSTYILMTFNIEAQVLSCHISYNFSFNNHLNTVALIFYCIVVVVPFFVSSLSCSKLFGASLIFSLLMTYLFARIALTSVWCFFAAILSILVFVSILKENSAGKILKL